MRCRHSTPYGTCTGRGANHEYLSSNLNLGHEICWICGEAEGEWGMPHGGPKNLGWYYVLAWYYSCNLLTPGNTATIVHHQNSEAPTNSLPL